MSDEASIVVRSHRHEYRVDFVDDVVAALAEAVPGDAFYLVDRQVLSLHPRLGAYLEGAAVRVVDPSEDAKSFAAMAEVLDALARAAVTRSHRLVAIGGGVTQDITAFAASIYMRGVPWVFVPTNLLSQCDSCIGSKTSINLGPYKNQLGTFYPPVRILIDGGFLATLPEAAVRSGLGEMLHYALVSGESDFAFFADRIPGAVTDRSVLPSLIRRSLEIKRRMVEIDEFDTGPRNVFNYGHSFGHALESVTGYTVPHGIAVAFGMDLANVLSTDLGLLAAGERDRWRPTLEHVWRGTQLPAVDPEAYVAALGRDKKNVGRQINVILTRGAGVMFKTPLEVTAEVRGRIEAFFTERVYERPL